MIYTIDEIKQKIRPIALKYQIPAAYVFGSYARNEATESSDVDILIDKTGSKISTLFDLGEVYNELSEIFNKGIDLVTTYALNKDNDDFKKYVMRERVAIYE
jgi:hypothetical protein